MSYSKIVECDVFSFSGTNCLIKNKIILLCEDLFECLFTFVVAVSFLFLPKLLSTVWFLVFEPVYIEMVIDLIINIYASPPKRVK